MLGDERAAIVFADPPYNVPIDGHASGLGAIHHRPFPMAREEQMPKLINMKGRRGIVLPGAVYIGRQMRFLRLKRSIWANPFKIGRDGTRTQVIARTMPRRGIARAGGFVNCPRRRARHRAGLFSLPRCDAVAVARRASHFRVAGPSAANGESRNA